MVIKQAEAMQGILAISFLTLAVAIDWRYSFKAIIGYWLFSGLYLFREYNLQINK